MSAAATMVEPLARASPGPRSRSSAPESRALARTRKLLAHVAPDHCGRCGSDAVGARASPPRSPVGGAGCGVLEGHGDAGGGGLEATEGAASTLRRDIDGNALDGTLVSDLDVMPPSVRRSLTGGAGGGGGGDDAAESESETESEEESSSDEEDGGGSDGLGVASSVERSAAEGAGGAGARKWNGWGYADTEFVLGERSGQVELSGRRYQSAFERDRMLPKLRPFVEDVLGIDLSRYDPGRGEPAAVPEPTLCEAFLRAIEGHCDEVSTDGALRVLHGHGHTCQEVHSLRFGGLERVPDAVVYPRSHEDVEAIMAAAVAHAGEVCLIPYGGGTSVSGALECPADEKRMIVSVAMGRMRAIKWVDFESMMACIEAGATGTELEARLRAQGVCMGHEPDSAEFSSLGGWVATRASGMKKNVYGNIEDIVVNVKMVTPLGTVEKGCLVPRASTGPDVLQMVLGSEGTLGIITEVVCRLRRLPECREFGSIAFPNFGAGVAAMREVAARRAAPASIRLVDNVQFTLGQAMKPAPKSPMKAQMLDAAKRYFVTRVKGFKVEEMCAATLLFQGTRTEVAAQQRVIYEIGRRYGGMAAGGEAGERGYFLTFMIAYLRDYGLNYGFLAESFECSVPWSGVLTLCHAVKERIKRSARENGVGREPLVSARVTQTYDTGACVYFYFGFNGHTCSRDPVATFTRIEHDARDEIIRLGGSLSHHHGVGKHRKEWMEAAVGRTGIEMLRGLKRTVDPANVMGSNNIIDMPPPAGADKP